MCKFIIGGTFEYFVNIPYYHWTPFPISDEIQSLSESFKQFWVKKIACNISMPCKIIHVIIKILFFFMIHVKYST